MYEEARPAFERLLDVTKRDPWVLYSYALYFWEWQDSEAGYREALRLYAEIRESQPGFEGVREGIARCEAALR